MNRRMFSLLLPMLPTALMAKRNKGLSVTLTGLDPRFVAQLKICADSRGLTLEQWIVFAAMMQSGYHENDGWAS